MSTAVLTEPETRQQILDQISHHEAELIRLREQLRQHPAVKTFFRFRCKPERFVFIYASDESTARRKLRERMDASYPGRWEIASTVVDVFSDPQQAAANSPGSLLRALTPEDAAEFAKDFREQQRSQPKARRLKHLPASTLDRDLESYETRQRRQQS